MKAKDELLRLVDRIGGLRVLVYGDFVLDEFFYGEIERISREAPVFIVSHQRSDFRPGCAANAVANLAALGAAPVPCGVLGDDDGADRLAGLFDGMGVATAGLVRVPGARTPLKTRVVAGGAHSITQQIVRLDRLSGTAGGAGADREVRRLLEELLPGCDAVVVSDYHIGGLLPETGAWLVSRTLDAGKPALADSRHRLPSYAGATATTPNQPEVEESLGMRIESDDDLRRAGRELLETLRGRALLITRGGEGMALFRPGAEPLLIPAFGEEEVVDITGAGDTVIAVFSLAVTAGADFELAAELANVAGGLTVLKKGASTVSPAELRAALGGA